MSANPLTAVEMAEGLRNVLADIALLEKLTNGRGHTSRAFLGRIVRDTLTLLPKGGEYTALAQVLAGCQGDAADLPEPATLPQVWLVRVDHDARVLPLVFASEDAAYAWRDSNEEALRLLTDGSFEPFLTFVEKG